MTDRLFRFGLVAAQAGSGADWVAVAQRAEELGFATLLVPDTVHTLSPIPACAAAAAVTSRLRVGPYVLSVPNRTAGQVAYETATLATLTDGRYELGIGAGRPGSEHDAAAFGMPFGSPGQRLEKIRATVRAVREKSPATQVLIAAAGPRMLTLAAELADTVALGLPPAATAADLTTALTHVNRAGGGADVELCQNLLAIGTELPADMTRFVRLDLAGLAAAGSVNLLTGTLDEQCDTLRRRRDEFGISYVCINSGFADQMAAVVERLAGT